MKQNIKRYRIEIPAYTNQKGGFVPHCQFVRASSPEEAIKILAYQVGYPDGLAYNAIQVFYDANGQPINTESLIPGIG